MALRPAPLMIDGARTDSATVRTANFMNGGRHEGVSSPLALKVDALPTPGRGVRIRAGAATILNRYQGNGLEEINQAYTVANVGDYDMLEGELPPVNAQATSHLICATIGDPEFSQVGHPWMPATPLTDAEKPTYQYARFWVIPNVAATVREFRQLNKFYPAYALARVDLPAGIGTYADAYIVDLRNIPLARAAERIEHIRATRDQVLNGAGGVAGAWQNFPGEIKFDLDIPTWATRAFVTGFLEGLRKTKAGTGGARVTIVGAGNTTVTTINEPAPAGAVDRVSYNLGGEIAIPPAIRGTTARVRVEMTPNTDGAKGFLSTDDDTSGQIRIRLEERIG